MPIDDELAMVGRLALAAVLGAIMGLERELRGYPAGMRTVALPSPMVSARTWAFLPEGGALGERMLAEAEKAGADMLVMGAYGHSRLREMVLGGVTQSVTAKAEIPVFMAH